MKALCRVALKLATHRLKLQAARSLPGLGTDGPGRGKAECFKQKNIVVNPSAAKSFPCFAVFSIRESTDAQNVAPVLQDFCKKSSGHFDISQWVNIRPGHFFISARAYPRPSAPTAPTYQTAGTPYTKIPDDGK
jgi:hypothetical protein